MKVLKQIFQLFIFFTIVLTSSGCEKEKCYQCSRETDLGYAIQFENDTVCGEENRNKWVGPGYEWDCDEEPYNTSSLDGTITGPSIESMSKTIIVFKDTTDCPCGESDNE